jgi:hypothetical protein
MAKNTSETHNVPTPYSPFHDRHYETTIKDDKGNVLGVGTSFSSPEEAERKASDAAAADDDD